MYKQLLFLFQFLKYTFKRKNKYSIHSPYFYNWANTILDDNSPYPALTSIQKIRQELLRNKKKITVADYGTGKSNKRTIASIAAHSAKSHKYGALLFKMAAFHKPHNMIELGTSLGLSAAYQAMARTSANFTTLEGCPQTASIAQQTFTQLKQNQIKITVGNFDQTFEKVLSEYESVDWIFFDGNHTYKATIAYFTQALPYIHQNTIFIFDDINWSKEMQQAWLEIKGNKHVTSTIDIFTMGIVFFDAGFSKQHFTLKY